jgi:hypothetical protein
LPETIPTARSDGKATWRRTGESITAALLPFAPRKPHLSRSERRQSFPRRSETAGPVIHASQRRSAEGHPERSKPGELAASPFRPPEASVLRHRDADHCGPRARTHTLLTRVAVHPPLPIALPRPG